jgi:heme exporter protein A
VGNKKFILETKDISKYFDRFKVLSNINIKLEEREFLTIFGANGAGKTTLLKIIAMLLKPNSGVIYFNGIDMQRSSDSVRKSIGFITHNTFLYNDLSSYENLKLYSILYDVKNCEEQINIVMEKVGLLRRSSEPIRNFSKGMHQRLAIARAFLHNPTLLLLDEPYSGLDQKALNVLNQMLENFHNEGKTAIITTHNIERGMEIADKVVVLNKGSIVFEKNKKQMEISEFKNMYVEILNTQL